MKSRFGAATLLIAVSAVLFAAAGSVPASAQGRASRPVVDRPDGPVWQVIRKNCTACHGIDDYAFYALDQPGWRDLIENKHKSGAGAGAAAKLNDADWNNLLTWLSGKFGPNTKPFPRNYVAPEITEFLTNPEGNVLLSRACSTCHSLDRVNDARNSLERWRFILLDMRERGARLSDEEVEKMVEWLYRVKGINPNQ